MDLAEFIETYRGPLIGLIASWGAPWDHAAEIAEESFCEAWLNREACRGGWNHPDMFGRWLRGVALNRYRVWARDRSRRRVRFVSDSSEILDRTTAPIAPSTENLDALRGAIERLPDKLRQVVLMHYLEETSVKQVADLLSVTVKTIEGRLYQARRELRRLLDDTHSTARIVRMLLCL